MKRVGKTLKRFWPLYLMFLPGAVYLFINCYIPMFGIQIAFRTYNARDGIYGSPWCGMENFEFLFRTNDAWIMTRNTLLYNFVFIVLGTVLAIAVAIILNEVKSKGAKQLYQTVILIPVILVIINIWKGLGYNMILYYATICGIDHSLYEAAVVDGANRWQQIWNITLPSLKSTIIILTLMALGGIFRSDFGLFYQVPQNSGPLTNVTQTIDTYVYRGLMTTSNIGMSSAAGVYQSIVGFILVVSANLVVRKLDSDSALF